ncbi:MULTISPECIES: VOC family protein [unclassified Nocardioides]|uniref:VOC family protein n=1 Tax=unclassified Nocardioides TaxID=2615069 RepID=UPI0006FF0891|nr:MULTISPECIES: VOC family protein [unclassified Nocardioides]KQY64708.1 glyoxalase [Nocardioides sp. Root140]KRF12610.1 glyoxalase [Nocardioides sp. Soil796]
MALAKSAVAVMLPITDPDRAQKFYGETLGLPYEGMTSEGAPRFTLGGGSELVLLPRPAGTQSESTAMSWEVHGIESEVTGLAERGVVFEDYDLPDLKTVDHICVMGAEKAAWFKDPDGNVLCIHEST